MTKPTKVSFENWDAIDPQFVHWMLKAHDTHYHPHKVLWMPFYVGFYSVTDAKEWIETTGIDLWSPSITADILRVHNGENVEDAAMKLR